MQKREIDPVVRAILNGNDYPEYVQREFDAYMAQHVRQNFEDEFPWSEPAMPAWHDLALVAVGAVIVAAVLWSWLS